MTHTPYRSISSPAAMQPRASAAATAAPPATQWGPLRSPDEAALAIGEDAATILATLRGQSTSDVENALNLMRPGTLTALQTAGMITLDDVYLTGSAKNLRLTDFGREMIDWCAEHIEPITATPPDQFDKELAAVEAEIPD